MEIMTLFAWYADHIWPIQRIFVKKIKRCKRCILSEKYTKIENGICEICRNFDSGNQPVRHSRHSIDDLSSLIRGYISRNKYDATLLLSGGKDSAYMLHKLRNDYPDLKIVCLTVNDGFMSKWSLQNARHITEKLNVDLMIINSYVDKFKETLRQAFLGLKGRGGYEVIDFADGNLIYSVGQEITRSLGIKIMIGGLSWVQLEKILGVTNFYRDIEGIRQLYPMSVWCTDEQDIRKYVKEHGLVLKGSDSPVVSNNRLIPTMSALDILNLGYSSFEPEFAQLIREGKSNRKVWLPVVELLEYFVRHGYLEKEMKRTLGELGLSVEQVYFKGS